MSEFIKTSLEHVLYDPISGSRPKGGVNNEGEIPSLGGENVTMQGGLNLTAVKKITSDFFNSMSRGHLKNLDVLINKDGANTGKSTIYRKSPFLNAAVNEHLFILRGKDGKIDQEYLHYLLQFSSIRAIIEKKITGSAQPGLNSSFVKNFPIELAPLPEQKKIASILTSVDEVIETTQKQIDKLQDLKKATMNELLTKGIGHTEFKDSVLGRIPKSWEVVSVLDSNISVLDGDRGNEYPKEKDFTKSGYCLFLSAKNVTKNGFRFNETAFISKDKDEKLRKGRLNRNDVIITTRGTVGNIAQYDTNIPFNVVRINSGMAIIRNQEKRLSSDYLYHILSSEIITQQIENLTFGSAQPQLTIGTLNELKIPIPQISEQLKIVHIFSSILKEVQNKKQKLDQTQSLKKSLMQDLLTGKVRVQVH